MAREAVEKTIDGEVYTFHQMDPMTSIMILTKILKITGSSIGEATNQIANSGIENFMGAEVDDIVRKINIGSIVASLCNRLDENEIKQIILAMTSQVIHKGQGEVSKAFNILFGGKVMHLIKVVGAAMEVEYADFFGEGSVLQGFLRQTAINLPT